MGFSYVFKLLFNSNSYNFKIKYNSENLDRAMNRKVCTPKKTGRSKTAKTADAVGGFAKQNFDNRPFCVAKCFDLLTAQDGAVAKGNFRFRKS
ncbi:MAG: hypothetical protein EGQ35_08070 [Clostridiales bacterium]|nr:hypothetical protein [Clostridiales bacterium]